MVLIKSLKYCSNLHLLRWATAFKELLGFSLSLSWFLLLGPNFDSRNTVLREGRAFLGFSQARMRILSAYFSSFVCLKGESLVSLIMVPYLDAVLNELAKRPLGSLMTRSGVLAWFGRFI